MSFRMNGAILIIFIMLCSTGYAHAQGLTPAHFEVVDSEVLLPSLSFGQSLLRYIGVKAIGRIKPPIGTKFIVSSSAYPPNPKHTDSTPCITASGTRVREGVVATNFLPLGTIISINNKPYIVEDRMARRFNGYYIDIWFPSTSKALEFGRRKLEITIVAYGKPGAALTPTPAQKITESEQERLRESLISSIFSLSKKLFSKTYDPNKYDVDCSQ
ncbi:MAG TPA: hypothetical protein VJI96_01320 [Candidatus Andersenbacteria bacterium]|nr:hypothetical protein [Candidatus Andersenbacteria bacterium]